MIAVFRIFLFFLFFSSSFLFSLGAQESSSPLKTSDINKIMQQIFAQHVDQKSISTPIIQHSLRVYIDQFDPDRVYLLDKEIESYLNLSESQLAGYEKEYKNGDFNVYRQLDNLFQKAISRARSYRSFIAQDNDKLIQEAKSFYPISHEAETMRAFASTEQELKARIKDEILSFLHNEIKRYGEKPIVSNLSQVMKVYDRHLRSAEDQYNYRNGIGELLTTSEQENLFSLHVLKALAKSLDAHTNFYNSEEAYDMKVRLEKGFEGIGIIFQDTPQGILVGSMVQDGPAAKSGQIEVKDQVLEINGTSIKEMSFEKLMEQIRVAKDDTITLLLSRKNKSSEDQDKVFTVSLKREPIILNDDRVDVSYENFGNGIIGKIVLHSFYQNDQGITSEKDVREAIRTLDKQGNLRGLILDLRENSGGFLSQAIKVAGLFVKSGVIVISKYSDGDEKYYRDVDGKVAYDGPLVILTSKGTASAAEIVAQALQDYGVALVVGDERTYGKGTIQSQTVTDSQGGTYFKVTVGKYYTVSGKTPQLRGVKADIVVPGPLSKSHIGEEYLEYTIKKEDIIQPDYADKLADIDPQLKPWYLKHYLPNLQQKQPLWKDVLPILKNNSEWRLTHNKNYQLFINRLNGEEIKNASLEEAETEEDALQASQKNFGADDLQMIEAVNILKDMVYLQSKLRHKVYMVGADSPLRTNTIPISQ